MRSHAERALGQGRSRLSPAAAKFVVEADIYHLNVSVVAAELIAGGKATDCRRNCKVSAAGPNKIVFESRRPIPPLRWHVSREYAEAAPTVNANASVARFMESTSSSLAASAGVAQVTQRRTTSI
jgi:hypothetical protein